MVDVGSILTDLSAAATIAVATLAIPTYMLSRKLVKVTQKQAEIAQYQLYSDHSPLLLPVGDLRHLLNDQSFIQWDRQDATLSGIRNRGRGVAYAIYGTLFGVKRDDKERVSRYIVWNYPEVGAGESGTACPLSPACSLDKNVEVLKGYSLYVPDDRNHIGVLARLTLTYHDDFGRKHISVCDYHRNNGWIVKRHFSGIEKDIMEFESESPMTKESNKFFYGVGKLAQS